MMKGAGGVLVLAGMMTPSPSTAETVAQSLGELGRRVKPGQKVQVLERSGRLYEGVITELDESALTVFAGESRTIAADELLRVERHGDSVRDGIVIGTLAGTVGGVIVMLGSRGETDEALAAQGCGNCKSPEIVALAAAEGALIGWLIDAPPKGPPQLCEPPPPRQARPSVIVPPIVGEGRRGLSVGVDF